MNCIWPPYVRRTPLQTLLRSLALVILFGTAASSSIAESDRVEVTVTYRERIALPSDAELDVQLLEVSPSGRADKRIASQRFFMDTVPMTIGLSHDPRLIAEGKTYGVTATIWSRNQRLFASNAPQAAFEISTNAVEIMLRMLDDPLAETALPRSISGIEWVVTEVLGTPWPNDDPATLMIDTEAHVSAFAGCNRFRGQASMSDGEFTMLGDLAGTMMACPDAVENEERRFLSALTRVTGYVRYGGGLVMTDAQGSAVLHLIERPE